MLDEHHLAVRERQHSAFSNNNELLRQYFPKSTDLSVHSPEDLQHVADELNDRPRKSLGWRTPAAVFASLQIYAV